MYCTKCGAQNSDSAAFCNACGRPMAAPPSGVLIRPKIPTGVLMAIVLTLGMVVVVTVYNANSVKTRGPASSSPEAPTVGDLGEGSDGTPAGNGPASPSPAAPAVGNLGEGPDGTPGGDASTPEPTADSFKAHVQRILDANPLFNMNFAAVGGSGPRPYVLSNPQISSYDIRKTDSLVNPVQGIAAVKYALHSDPRGGASAMDYQVEFRITSGFKDGSWSVIDISRVWDFGNTEHVTYFNTP